MTPVSFIIRDTAGRPIRWGTVRPEDFELQAGPGETVEPATEETVAQAKTGVQVIRARAAEHRQDRVAVILEALRAKGIDLKDADLAAAAATLQARRAPPVGAGK